MADFDWDSWVGKLSFNDLRDRFGYHPSIREIPTCYNDKNKLAYIASLDLDFSSNFIDGLKIALNEIIDSYCTKKQKNEDTAKMDLELAILRNDFNFICKLLDQAFLEQNEGDSEYEYECPDELFKELVGKKLIK